MAELREYLPSDFDRLWELDQACFSPEIAYSRAEFEYYWRCPHDICLLALESDATLAFILGQSSGRQRILGRIVTRDVAAQARRSRIGSILIETLEARFRQAGCRSTL